MKTTTTKAPPADTGRCGETAGYERHRSRGQESCQPCRDAKAAYLRARRPGSRPVAPDDRELARKALPLTSGGLACTDLPHRFRPLSGSQCSECWGWLDDPRHPVVDLPVAG